jgi:hypothetical protein
LLIARFPGGATEAVGGGSLNAGRLEGFSQNPIRARWGAGVSSGGSGGDRGISKSGGRGNAKMSRAIANLQ